MESIPLGHLMKGDSIMSHADETPNPRAERLLTTIERAVADLGPQPDEELDRRLRRLVADAIARDFDTRMNAAVHRMISAVCAEIDRALTKVDGQFLEHLRAHQELHHSAGPDGQLTPTSIDHLLRLVDAKISEHLTDDHTYGAIGEMVDSGVAQRFEEFARFLTYTTTSSKISEIAAQVDEAIDQEQPA